MRKHAWKNNRRNVLGTIQNFFYMYIYREQLVHLYCSSSVCTPTDNYCAEVQFLDTLHGILIRASVINIAIVKCLLSLRWTFSKGCETVEAEIVSAQRWGWCYAFRYFVFFSSDSIKWRPEYWDLNTSIPSLCATKVAVNIVTRILCSQTAVPSALLAESCKWYRETRDSGVLRITYKISINHVQCVLLTTYNRRMSRGNPATFANDSHASTRRYCRTFLRIFWRTFRALSRTICCVEHGIYGPHVKSNEPYHADDVLTGRSQSVLVPTFDICI